MSQHRAPAMAEQSQSKTGPHRTSPRRWPALRRWYPQLPVAAAIGLIGLLLVMGAARREFGLSSEPAELTEIERFVNPLHHGPILELALGVSLLAMSVGIALRSRLAWAWCIGAMAIALSLRIPPAAADLPVFVFSGGILALLIAHHRHFRSRSAASSALFAVVILSTFFLWAILGALRLGEQFEPPVRDAATALYFVVVTASSVGFGDIVARGTEARLFVTAMIVVGVVVGATTLTTILLPLIGGRMREVLGGRPHVERSGHYVIVGRSPLARNAALELEKRGQQVTLVLATASEEAFYRERDVVVGDPTDLSVLRSAGAPHAKGVLALSTDDADNGFVVLGVSEIDATIPTVAALNDPANHSRLQRTQPSLLLSLQALGGQLLAMALTGEHVDVEMLSGVLQVHGTEPETGS